MTALDTNILVSLWNPGASLHDRARHHLEAVQAQGGLVISAPVYAELMAGPRTIAFLDEFLHATGIVLDWNLGEDIWREAGRAYRSYAATRSGVPPRRILADFVIGAHASRRGHALLTLDTRHYRTAFPKLRLLGLD